MNQIYSRLSLSLAVILPLLGGILPKQERAQPNPQLILRCEEGCSGHSSVMENTITLSSYIKGPPAGTAVLRVCSKRQMPLALAMSAMDARFVADWLINNYDSPADRILFLRSEDCPGPEFNVTAAEMWAVPRNATLPSHIESIKSCQFEVEEFKPKKEKRGSWSYEGAIAYKLALRNLITELRARPKAVGVVYGYYLRRPNPRFRRRMLEAQRMLARSGLSRSRYFVGLRPWDGEYTIDPPDPEPKYPSVFLAEVSEGCNQE